MDENKKEKLEEIGYKLHTVCGLCKFGNFKPGNDFGDCKKFTYKHLKHSAEAKQLSIVRFGSCPNYEMDIPKLAFLHSYTEFLD